LAKEFAPTFTEEDLVNLTKYDIYLKLMIDGVASSPFSATTLPPITGITSNRERVIALSREKYANSRVDVEDKISQWAQVNEMERRALQSEQAKEPVPVFRKPGLETNKYDGERRQPSFRKPLTPETDGRVVVNCKQCNKRVSLNFTPDPSKPIYCRECWKNIEADRRIKQLAAFKQQALPEALPSPVGAPRLPQSSEANIKAVPAKTISLSEAFKQGPVSFKGKPLKTLAEKKEQEPPQRVERLAVAPVKTQSVATPQHPEMSPNKEADTHASSSSVPSTQKEATENSISSSEVKPGDNSEPRQLEAGKVIKF